MRAGEILERMDRCPRCAGRGEDRSGDNLAIYKDGHSHCYKCGYHTGGGSGLNIQNLRSRLLEQEKGKSSAGNLVLPADFTFNLAEKGLNWLRKYELTDEEIDYHRVGWSDSYDSLVFPVYDVYGNLLMIQSRKFSDSKRKYYTEGKPEKVYHILGNADMPSVVVVEDLVSAIKVSRVAPAMPLWGSNISAERITNLCNRFKNLFIWLDEDKAAYAIKRSIAAGPYFDSVRPIVTPKDPKEYDEVEIQEILHG